VRDTLAIVLAFNEEASLPDVLRCLAATCPELEVLVVNDGSEDRTGEVGRAAGARVVDLPYNSGVATAEQTGFLHALDRGFLYTVRLDGDGQHDPAEAARLLAELRAGNADLVIGSRFVAPPAGGAGTPGARPPLARRAGIAWLSFLVRVLSGQVVTDPTSGYRAFSQRAVRFLASAYPADYPEPESILMLSRGGFRIVEVPASSRARQGGRSSIGRLAGFQYVLKVTFALLIQRLRRPGA
jgi:glycosyltransferase involved in cell wall biosynthesis